MYKNMSSDYGNMIYEIGKTYHEDYIELCKRGFHYCEDLLETLRFYNYEDSNFLMDKEYVNNPTKLRAA